MQRQIRLCALLFGSRRYVAGYGCRGVRLPTGEGLVDRLLVLPSEELVVRGILWREPSLRFLQHGLERYLLGQPIVLDLLCHVGRQEECQRSPAF